MRLTSVGLAALALALAFGMCLTRSDAQAVDFDTAKKYYDETLSRPSLYRRWKAMLKVADTKDPRALDMLAKRYERPEDPFETVSYLVTEVCVTRFSDPKFVDTWDAWARRNTLPRDAWLWYLSQKFSLNAKGPDALLADAKNAKLSPFIRAAAIEALATRSEPALLTLIPEIVADLPAKGAERAVLLESCVACLLGFQSKMGKDDFKPLLELVIRQLDEKKTDDRSKTVIARVLRELFKTDSVSFESAPWLDLLNNKEPEQPKDSKKGAKQTAAKPKFLGIEGAGKRIAYIIDLSDSMLIPLTAKEKEDLKKPITGNRKKDQPGEQPKEPPKDPKKDAKIPTEKDLPWDKINNRFEAAREFLKLSLKTLDKDMSFVIIAFGDYAEVFAGTGIVQASKQNVDFAVKSLDALRPGPADTIRTNGTLKGNTNIHGGFLKAFRAVPNTLVKGEEHVHKDAFEQGIDTVFFLSDGHPSWDDFACKDKRDPDEIAGDPETKTPLETTEELIFQSPYTWEDYVFADIERMNLFRKCEIHCIGLGEANFTLLAKIAKVGRGVVRKVGSEK